MKVKKIFSALTPKKVMISVDNIEIPRHNCFVTGGIILSKEKNELATPGQVGTIKLPELNFPETIKAFSEYQRQPLTGLEHIIGMPSISQGERMEALKVYRELALKQKEVEFAQSKRTNDRLDALLEFLPEFAWLAVLLFVLVGSTKAACNKEFRRRLSNIGKLRLTA